MIESLVVELERSPLAALGGLAALLAYLDLYPSKWLGFRSKRTNGQTISDDLIVRDAIGHAVLWPSASVCIAYLASQMALPLGFFLAVAAYCVSVFTIYEQSKKFREFDSAAPLAIFGISAGIYWGVVWTRIVEVIMAMSGGTDSTSSDPSGGVMVSIVFLFATIFGGLLMFLAAVPGMMEDE